jgi:hypothetical protein
VAGTVKTVARHAATAAGVLTTAVMAGLGMPALGALVLLAVLILAVMCWVIASQDRTNRVSQILLARRGSPLTPAAPVESRTQTSALEQALNLITGRKSSEAR